MRELPGWQYTKSWSCHKGPPVTPSEDHTVAISLGITIPLMIILGVVIVLLVRRIKRQRQISKYNLVILGER